MKRWMLVLIWVALVITVFVIGAVMGSAQHIQDVMQ